MNNDEERRLWNFSKNFSTSINWAKKRHLKLKQQKSDGNFNSKAIPHLSVAENKLDKIS